MRRVAQVLGVSRSQLSQCLKEPRKSRSIYRKPEDDDLLVELRALVDERLTYGYRRVTALLNQARRKARHPNANHKRIYRLMSQHGLLLQRYTGRPPVRAHDGIIRTIHPNVRWTSDGFQIPCSDQAVHVAFSLDTCDREVISWGACTSAISHQWRDDPRSDAS